MRFGYFDDLRQEYVITTPRTPLPWINYLGTDGFFSLVSNTAGGYSFYRDAKLLRLTRYRYNNVPDGQRGPPLLYQGRRHGLESRLAADPDRAGLLRLPPRTRLYGDRGREERPRRDPGDVRPVGDPCEVIRVNLRTRTGAPKDIDLFSYVEFCLWNADDDSRNFQRNFSTGEVEVEGGAIYHKTEYRERRRHYTVFAANAVPDSFETSRDAFLGAYRSAANPAAVENGKCANSIAHGWSPVGVHHFHLKLQPGETRSLVFVLAFIENPKAEKVQRARRRQQDPRPRPAGKVRTDAQVDAALCALRAYWEELLSRLHHHVPGRKARPHGQYLEPVPVHGHLQHEPQRLLL